MATDPNSIVRGPAIVTYNDVTMYTESDIIVTPNIETIKIPSSVYGDADVRLSDISHSITFSPIGKWAYRTAILPHATPRIGDSIFGATARDLVIQTRAGKRITYKRAAVTKMPDIHFGTVAPLFGQVTLQTFGDPTVEWSDAAKHAVIAAMDFDDNSFDPGDIVTQPYSLAWGAESPWNDFSTENGVDVSFDLATAPVRVDNDGTVDLTLENLVVTAKFAPVGVSEADILSLLKIQGDGVARGLSLGNINSNSLVIAGTGVHFTIYRAAPIAGPTRFGRTILRAGEVAMISTRQYVAGALQPLFRADTAAP